MIGKMLGNRYEVMEQLGGGGMAVVYKGRDVILNRLVTIKLMRPEYTSDEDFVRRFRREAQSVASLSHPNIVSIYDVGWEGDMHYLVMEYVDGKDLRSIIKREGPLNPVRAVAIARQICDALEHAHENNIVHRDIKPHNILITRNGRAKLTDFGIAREASAATVTTTDTIVGSVHYLSPEQARGEAADPKSDLYSLGVVLYEMLAGSVPFSGDSPISIALKHIQSDPEPPTRRKPDIPVELERVVMRALHKDPDKRYGSAGEMSFQLEEALSGDDEDTTRIIPLDREDVKALNAPEYYAGGRRPARRLSAAGWTVLVILLALVAGTVYYAYHRFVNVPEVVVPLVVGKPLKEAQDILAAKNLDSKVKEQYDSSASPGIVIAQDYGPDDPPVKVNRVITLTVSKGAELKTVPNLVGQNLIAARDKLIESGLEMDDPPGEAYSSEVEKGLVVSQQPAANQRVPKGTKVSVTVSSGPAPAGVKVPDLKGLYTDQAKQKLSENKLELDGDIIYQYSADYLRGQIVSQFPAAGETVNEGTKIRVNVSSGPGPPARDADVIVPIPKDGKTHEVKITVTDVRGTNPVYIRNHNPGDQVVEKVRYWGRATLRVYLDGNEIYKEVLN
ncbi:MAG: Stk1 family PASTA domain-containing Ser/Thr kinase [Peptococcaceae bacterium]|nr:Stk1 family PASTA domain-containing Ser/Thr kinase [Peptococcaceae bacterium]